MPYEVKGKYTRRRIRPVRSCAPGSFRTKRIKSGLLIVCCPRGYYSRRSRRCRRGMILQSRVKYKRGYHGAKYRRRVRSRRRKSRSRRR